MKSLFLFVLLSISTLTFGQSPEQMSVFGFHELKTYEKNILTVAIDKRAEDSPFVSFAIKSKVNSIDQIQYRLKSKTEITDWLSLKNDSHNMNTEKDISSLIFLPNSIKHIELRLMNYNPELGDEVHLFYPNNSISGLPLVRGQEEAECPCPQPTFKGRDQWCQSSNCPVDITPIITEVSHLIVHHTAGANTSSDWSAVVFSIWNYHVNTNGWDDIGYNWLIDPNGVVYEGRANNIQGAHFCGKNGNTMGICILGTYTDVAPTTTSMESLKRLFAWKSCQEDIDPTGLSYHPPSDEEIFVVSGHRDGCATACPGDMLYELIPNLRDSIAEEITTSCNNILPPIQLTAAEVNDGTVELNWTDQSNNESNFIIERKIEASSYFYPIGTTESNTTNFIDLTQLDDQTLEYRVLAANPQDTSIYSNIAQVQITSETITPTYLDEVEVYPTVFEHTINVEYSGKDALYMRILDQTGKLVHTSNRVNGSSTTINGQDWPAGIYFVHLKTDYFEKSIKIIKVNE